jgi:sugar O-acyltransferase (sialic acid O-acetyltransferase NeuD family)
VADLVIFGAGDLARLVRYYFETDGGYRVVAFSIDGEQTESSFHGLPLIPFDQLEEVHPPHAVEMFVAVGYRRVNRGRAEVYDRARRAGYRLATYVSPLAMVSPSATIGDNCFLFEGVIVQPFVEVGSDTIMWSGAVVAHDSIIGNHCFLAPRASISGNVRVGDFCFVGNNATVRDGVELAESTVVGAGALAMSSTAVGAILRGAATPVLEGRTSDELDRL